jgi:collagen triple helix repeat protein
MKSVPKKVIAFAVITTAIFVSVGLTASAGTKPPSYHHGVRFGPFCVSKSTGVIRGIKLSQVCRAGEARVTHSPLATTPGATGLAGLTGLAGVNGSDGAPGPQGSKGEKGDTGLTGAVGPASPIGLTGARGATGPAGSEGVAGPKGETGAIGLTGLTGPKGDTGASGPAGLIGETGTQGPKGDAGNTGPAGATGPAGLKGDTGPAGPAGPKGDAGIDGSSIVTAIQAGTSGQKTVTVSCPTGKFALSGGFSAQGSVTESFRTADGHGWTVTQSSGNSDSLTAYAYCV